MDYGLVQATRARMTQKSDFQAQMRAVETKAARVVTVGRMSGDPIVEVLEAMVDAVRLGVATATTERPSLTAGQVRTIATAVAGAVALRLLVIGLAAVLLAAGVAGLGAYTMAGGFSQVCGQTQAGVRVCQWTPR